MPKIEILIDDTTGDCAVHVSGARIHIEAGEKGMVIQHKAQTAEPKPGEANSDLIKPWENFYASHGFKFDFSGLHIPKKREGFDRLIIVAVSAQQAFEMCQKHFKCWKYTDKSLDDVITDKPEQSLPYAIWIRERVEADEEWKRTSANQLNEKGISGVTLTARLLFEAKYFLERESPQRRHLDYINFTLATGSRSSGGNVPNVDWHVGAQRLEVDWYDPDGALGLVRVREAVY